VQHHHWQLKVTERSTGKTTRGRSSRQLQNSKTDHISSNYLLPIFQSIISASGLVCESSSARVDLSTTCLTASLFVGELSIKLTHGLRQMVQKRQKTETVGLVFFYVFTLPCSMKMSCIGGEISAFDAAISSLTSKKLLVQNCSRSRSTLVWAGRSRKFSTGKQPYYN